MKQWRSQDNTLLAIAAPLAVYLALIAMAFGIGNRYACAKGWVNWGLYFGVGMFALELFVLQLCLNQTVHVGWRLALGLIAVAAGVGVWVWAFDASGVHFMCRPFGSHLPSKR